MPKHPMSSIQPISSQVSPASSQYQEMIRQIRISKAAAETKNDAPNAAQSEKANPTADADNDGD